MLIMLIVALPITIGLLVAWVRQGRLLARERAERRITEALHAREARAIASQHRQQLTEQHREAAVLMAAASVIDTALRGDREGDGHA